MTAPCYQCPDRCPGCHDRCPRYREFREDRDRKNAMIREMRRSQAWYDELVRKSRTRQWWR